MISADLATNPGGPEIICLGAQSPAGDAGGLVFADASVRSTSAGAREFYPVVMDAYGRFAWKNVTLGRLIRTAEREGDSRMLSELANIREHWVRYRDVTLQHLDMLAGEQLAWRPQPELFSCGQHFVHILQTEKYYARGLFHQDWDATRLHFPASLPAISHLRSDFTTTRAQTLADFDMLTDANLDEVKQVPNVPVDLPLRWWLWFVLEHEIHHKAQLALYLRQLGKVPPFFAMVLTDRPDIRIRSEWGGI